MSRSYSTSQLLDHSDDVMPLDAPETSFDELAESVHVAPPSFSDLNLSNESLSGETVTVHFDGDGFFIAEPGSEQDEPDTEDDSTPTLARLFGFHPTLSQEIEIEERDAEQARSTIRKGAARYSAFDEALAYCQKVRNRSFPRCWRQDSHTKISSLPSECDTISDVLIAAKAVLTRPEYIVVNACIECRIDFDSLPVGARLRIQERLGTELLRRRIVPITTYLNKRVRGQRLLVQRDLIKADQSSAETETKKAQQISAALVKATNRVTAREDQKATTYKRIFEELLVVIARIPHVRRAALVAAVAGNTATKMLILDRLENEKRVIAVRDGQTRRYYLPKLESAA